MTLTKITNPVNGIPEDIFEFLQLPEGAYVVGGSAISFYKDEPVGEKDIDIVYDSHSIMTLHLSSLKDRDKTIANNLKISDNYMGGSLNDRVNYYATTNNHMINLIGFDYGDLAHQLSRFDLTPTQVGYDHEGNLYFTDAFIETIETGEMTFVNFNRTFEEQCKSHRYTTNPEELAWKRIYERVEKYNKKGFKSSNEIVVKILGHA